MSSKQLKTFIDFSGGLSEIAPDNMRDNELIDAQNAVPDERGGLSKSRGTVRYNETEFDSEPIEILIEFGRDDGIVELLAFSGTTIRTWEDYVLKDNLPAMPTDWDIYNNKLYWVDGTNFWVYDGHTVEEVEQEDPPPEEEENPAWDFVKEATFIEQRGQRHFFAKDDSNRMYFSEVGNPNHVKTENFIDAITHDSDVITGLKEFAGSLLVFKRGAVFKWSGWSPIEDVRFDLVPVHKGAISNRTICRVENMLFYMAEDGVYALTNPNPDQISSTTNLAERKIENIIKDAKNKQHAHAIYHRGSYRLSISNDEQKTNNIEYRFFPNLTQSGSWFGGFTHPTRCYLETFDGRLFSGHPETGLIFEHGKTHNYDGDPIPLRIITRPIDIVEGMVRDSKTRRFYLAARQFLEEESSVTVRLKMDYREQKWTIDLDDSLVWGQGVWGTHKWGWVDLITKEISVGSLGKGKRLQVVIENDVLDEPVTIYGIGVMFKARKPRADREGVEEVSYVPD